MSLKNTMESRSTGNNHLHQYQVPNLYPQFGHYYHQFLGTQNPNTFHSLPQTQFASCYYYHPTDADSSSSSTHPEYPAADSRNLAALQQRGVDSNANVGAQVTLPADCKAYSANPYLYSSIASYPIPVINPLGNVTRKKQLKKLKLLQYFCCEICNIDCNSKDVLDRHKLGKKHKKNLEKLRDPNAPGSLAMVQQNLPLIGPQPCPNHGDAFLVENPVTTTADITVTAQKNRKKAACETPEDLEIKRRKVVNGGADSKAIRTCTICKVVCNSETVFRYHLMGQKHAAALRKSAAASLGTSVN